MLSEDGMILVIVILFCFLVWYVQWNELDLARDIYHNATIEQIGLLRFIVNREKKAEQLAAEWMKRSTVSFPEHTYNHAKLYFKHLLCRR